LVLPLHLLKNMEGMTQLIWMSLISSHKNNLSRCYMLFHKRINVS
jgi:hypothetical protein